MKKIKKFIPLFIILCIVARSTVLLSLYDTNREYDESFPLSFYENVTDTKENITDLRIMSENLQADYKGFGGSGVSERASVFSSLLKGFSPDVVAVQEMSINWYRSIKDTVPSYKTVRKFSAGVLLYMTGIIYNENTVTLLNSGDLKYSSGNIYIAGHAVWGLFKQKITNKQFVLVSTHLNLIREGTEKEDFTEAQQQSCELKSLCKMLYVKYGCPVIIAGDFNSKENEEIYNTLLNSFNDCRTLAKTLLIYGGNKKGNKKVVTNDHIFILGKANVNKYILFSKKSTKAVSDHCPVTADIAM